MKKPSGANVEEWQRHGVKVQFRLTKEETERLEVLARKKGQTLNACAAEMLRRALSL